MQGHPDLPAPLPGLPVWPRSFRNSARPSSRRCPRCSAPTCSGWPPSSTATAPAPPTYLFRRRSMTTDVRRTARAETATNAKGASPHDDHPQVQPLPQEEASPRSAGTATAGGLRRRRCQRSAAFRGRRARHLGQEERARVDARHPVAALRTFDKKPMPNWGSNLEGIDFDNIRHFVRSTEKQAASLGRPARGHRNTYDRLGIPGRRSSDWCPVSPRSTSASRVTPSWDGQPGTDPDQRSSMATRFSPMTRTPSGLSWPR